MLEIGLVLVVLAGATLAIGGLRRHRVTDLFIDDDVVDLPCPWCRAQTREDDVECPSCHQTFGQPAHPS